MWTKADDLRLSIVMGLRKGQAGPRIGRHDDQQRRLAGRRDREQRQYVAMKNDVTRCNRMVCVGHR